MIVRPAREADAVAIHSLIEANRERGHLLSRTVTEISTRIASAGAFYVAEPAAGVQSRIVGCGEVLRLSSSVAEIRSLVVDEPWRGNGVAGRLVTALHARARLDGHDRLCAFSHDPVPFMRLGFSIVPRSWLPEKISADCAACPLFRRCGQYALLLPIASRKSRPWQPRRDAA
jgi:amino-acid N-acetyltransferase